MKASAICTHPSRRLHCIISLSHERFLSRICSFERVSLHNANSALFLALGCYAKAFRLAAYRITMVAVSVGAFGAVKFSVKYD